MPNFAIIGVAGFVAPRHLQAIRDTGCKLLAAVDPNDSVGVLDRYFPDTRFFTEIERFDRFLEKLRRRPDQERVHYVSVCSPNYLHDAHVRLALRVRAHVICEKPLVISPWNLDQLTELESEYDRRIFNVLQLRHHPSVVELKKRLESERSSSKTDVCLTYITRRGPWYQSSWKGSIEKSGGVAMNIGIHFFDLLMWLFGRAEHSEVHKSTPQKMAGFLELEKARVKWFLSIDSDDLPAGHLDKGLPAHRSITIDGKEFDLSGGFTDLHTKVYEHALDGVGFGIEDARASIELVHAIRGTKVIGSNEHAHPALNRYAGGA